MEVLKAKKGFTLIELLVVIAIIAVLLAILMPALSIAKDIAKRITCSSNLRSLTLAVNLYSEDNEGESPISTNRWYDGFNSSQPYIAGWCGQTINENGDYGNSANWQQYPKDVQVNGDGVNNHVGLTNGQLWSYIETSKAWRCPTDPKKEEFRSYCMTAQWVGLHNNPVFGLSSLGRGVSGWPISKLTQVKLPSDRFMFVDGQGLNMDAYYALDINATIWWNPPHTLHSNGTVHGYADGHVEGYKFSKDTVLGNYNTTGAQKDLDFYMRAIWGK